MICIDKPMPKCCDECFALDEHGDYPFCLISQDQRGYTFNVRSRRMPTCPLLWMVGPKWMCHGYWKEQEGYDGDGYYTCSVYGCDWVTIDGTPEENNMRYCPECGARMDGDLCEVHEVGRD